MQEKFETLKKDVEQQLDNLYTLYAIKDMSKVECTEDAENLINNIIELDEINDEYNLGNDIRVKLNMMYRLISFVGKTREDFRPSKPSQWDIFKITA